MGRMSNALQRRTNPTREPMIHHMMSGHNKGGVVAAATGAVCNGEVCGRLPRALQSRCSDGVHAAKRRATDLAKVAARASLARRRAALAINQPMHSLYRKAREGSGGYT